MATLADMKTRIAGELGRSNLTADIAAAITTAITEYQKERFRFSDITPSAPPTFNTVAAQWVYGSAANANIGTAFNIDYVLMSIGGTVQELLYMRPAELRLYNQQTTMQGQPGWWSYEGNELLLAPVPNAVWQVTLGLFRNVAAPADDGEAGNVWMNAAELLIRSRAKYEIAVHKTRNPTMAQAMSPQTPNENGGVTGAAYSAWRSLKRETNRITSGGRIRAMQF